MLTTCCSNTNEQTYDKYLTSFPLLFQTFSSKSHIPDSVFAELGFRPDKDSAGNEVHKPHKMVEGESRKCENFLTHV